MGPTLGSFESVHSHSLLLSYNVYVLHRLGIELDHYSDFKDKWPLSLS